MGTGTSMGIHYFFLTYVGWISDIRYDMGMSIECDTGTDTLAKME